MNGFWTIHCGLDREGPGTPDDVAWAAAAAGVSANGRVCDVGCGPGGDLAAWRQHVPTGEVVGLDPYLSFVVEASLRFAGDHGISVRRGTILGGEGLASPHDLGPFDLIWSAGAIYFEGVQASLSAWRQALAPGGAVAFSAPYVVDASDADAVAFFGADSFDTEQSLTEAIAAAGYVSLAQRRVSDAGWIAYYDAIEARCRQLEAVDDSEVASAIVEARAEADEWARLRARLGYKLHVVRPV